MNKVIPLCIAAMLFIPCQAYASFDSLTAAQLHQRLLSRDTLMILDVREFTSEYEAGHIAEPSGQLPLTPACMPWNSGVLRAKYSRLPKNIDIVVHCASGARSRQACAFLDSLGFTRIFNLLHGFGSWTFETRSGAFGDHTGGWINATFTKQDTVIRDSAVIILRPAAFIGFDSVYCEVHFASGKQPAPSDAPVSDVSGLFRITALDKFGVPLFTGDSLTLSDTIGLTFAPHAKHGGQLVLEAPTGKASWGVLSSDYHAPFLHRGERVLRQWYDVVEFTNAISSRRAASYPNQAPALAAIKNGRLFDARGRLMRGEIVSTGAQGLVQAAGRGMYLCQECAFPVVHFAR